MKRRIFVVISLFLLVAACSNKQEKFDKKIKKTIKSYIEISENTQVDSIQILRTDSLSDYYFTKYILKQVLENYLEELSFTYEHLSDTAEPEEIQLKQETGEQINKIIDRLAECDSKLYDMPVDTINVSYYFVAAIVYTTDSTGNSSQQYYGFPLTTDFEVREINELGW